MSTRPTTQTSPNHEWLQRLKAGDKVIAHEVIDDKVGVVRKVTAVHSNDYVELSTKNWYRRSDGVCVARYRPEQDRPHYFISEATPERLAAIRARARRVKLLRQIQEFDNWGALSDEQVEVVAAIVEQYKDIS
jgi:hypothetical protein